MAGIKVVLLDIGKDQLGKYVLCTRVLVLGPPPTARPPRLLPSSFLSCRSVLEWTVDVVCITLACTASTGWLMYLVFRRGHRLSHLVRQGGFGKGHTPLPSALCPSPMGAAARAARGSLM